MSSGCLKVKCVSFLDNYVFITEGKEKYESYISLPHEACVGVFVSQDLGDPKAQFANYK